ncbi:MAG: ATP synthase F0 subunit C [Halobacteriovoraceae bacterium]|nr:ATP synthase F0 subunit C [Halobacteriovoraceae bacterium]
MKKLMLVLSTVFFSFAAFGEAAYTDKTGVAWAGAFLMALAVLGGTYAQGKAAAATFEGIARNPSARAELFVIFIIGMALIESLVILGFVVSGNVLGVLN